MLERKSCIPFKTIKHKVNEGANFQETLGQVKNVTNSFKERIFTEGYLNELSLKNQLIHNLAYTAVGLTLAVGYEYARLKYPGLNLPSLEPMLPAASLTPSSGGRVTGQDIKMIDKLKDIGNYPGVDKGALNERIAKMMNENLKERKNKK